jgi:hypothetical protein
MSFFSTNCTANEVIAGCAGPMSRNGVEGEYMFLRSSDDRGRLHPRGKDLGNTIFVLTCQKAADNCSMLFCSSKPCAIQVLHSESIIHKFGKCPMCILINCIEYNCKFLFNLEFLGVWFWCSTAQPRWHWSGRSCKWHPGGRGGGITWL